MKLPQAFSPAVMAELAKPVQSYDPRAAQVVPGVDAKWCLVQISTRDVEAELTKRRFGIYVPEERETVVKRGRKVDRRRSMFPGYVLVFLWLDDSNWSRLMACDGVIDLIGTLHEEEVDLIRAVENARGFPGSIRKPRRHSRVRQRRWEEWLVAIRSLDSERRNQALRKLLSLF